MLGIVEHRSLSHKAMPALDENAKRRNNGLHHVSRFSLCREVLDKRLAMTGEYMKTMFEKGVLA
ncbi:hypothetical protein [Limnohabitans sp.]|uniref:hypothetical protein n=1 Tax=Limnohabitans sp. TaxID=1907725 RepID=UPI00333FFF32